MLPVELFTESLAFLAYYDPGALKITSHLCSYVASRCAKEIRIFDFSEFTLVVHSKGLSLFEDADGWNIMKTLARFTDDDNAIAFVSGSIPQLRLRHTRKNPPEFRYNIADHGNEIRLVTHFTSYDGEKWDVTVRHGKKDREEPHSSDFFGPEPEEEQHEGVPP